MFSPPTLTINPGDTVTFINAGGAPTTSMRTTIRSAARTAATAPAAMANPRRPLVFDRYVRAATAGQSIRFHCDMHGSMGMTGTITVNGTGLSGNVPITAGFTGAWYRPEPERPRHLHRSAGEQPDPGLVVHVHIRTARSSRGSAMSARSIRRRTRRRSKRCRRRAAAGFRTSIRPTSRNPRGAR